jgi:uncharacterized protein YndB with AHSA1/START domain
LVAHQQEGVTTVSTTTDYEIERDILIEAPVEVVWRTVTEPDQMTLWFADKVDLVVEPGAHGYMGFGEQGGPVVVEAVEPPTRFSFRWNHPTGEDPTPTNSLLVEFTLTPEGDHTRLRVTEGALASLERPDIDKATYAEEHIHGWGVFLDRLPRAVAEAA